MKADLTDPIASLGNNHQVYWFETHFLQNHSPEYALREYYTEEVPFRLKKRFETILSNEKYEALWEAHSDFCTREERDQASKWQKG